ncbi:MAG: addiction module antitoxin RelB [Kaistia sp. SCN 65-12]|mgnify:CR=1 FL=1|nr:MAG: addiction module antitoxin RelB [Kaistia sp. SCN 65-12]
MIEIRQTTEYASWFAELRDERARARIDARIYRLSLGHAGDAKLLGQGVSELRINTGPGYRIYFTRRREVIVMLLCAGDKNSQSRDIKRAKALAEQWTE